VKILDEQELTVRVEEINDRLFSMHDTVNSAIIKVDEANTLSHFAVERIDTIRETTTSYQTAIDQLQTRIAELEHKIDLLTGPCICEPLL
jgi:chromosome condensin MukBEF ATPase and DNA-binding subunit MukB